MAAGRRATGCAAVVAWLVAAAALAAATAAAETARVVNVASPLDLSSLRDGLADAQVLALVAGDVALARETAQHLATATPPPPWPVTVAATDDHALVASAHYPAVRVFVGAVQLAYAGPLDAAALAAFLGRRARPPVVKGGADLAATARLLAARPVDMSVAVVADAAAVPTALAARVARRLDTVYWVTWPDADPDAEAAAEDDDKGPVTESPRPLLVTTCRAIEALEACLALALANRGSDEAGNDEVDPPEPACCFGATPAALAPTASAAALAAWLASRVLPYVGDLTPATAAAYLAPGTYIRASRVG